VTILSGVVFGELAKAGSCLDASVSLTQKLSAMCWKPTGIPL